MKNAVPVTEPSFLSGAISAEQIETINLKRMIYTCICAMGIQLINLLNPDFWEQPILWGGSVYLVVFSVTFLFLAHRVSQKKTEKNLRLLHTAFWSLLTLGVFPFLVRDAGGADMPINCVILCTVLICAPLLQVKELKVIFTVSGVMNFAAVVRCQNGQEGVDAFCASAPGEYSAVLMDVRMPVLDGLGAARAIRSMARPDAPEIPIIALTANTFEEDKEACFLAGMNDHVAKPIEPKKLYGALAKALRKTPEEN